MAAILCPYCTKANPDTLDVCQFCGTPLKNRGTEPLPTIRPGEMPVKQQTSDLESTLPAWLRDIRKGDSEDGAPPPSPVPGIKNPPAASQTAKPETPKKKEDSPLDFLAGLSQINDDEEAVPDWLASLTGKPSSAPAAGVQPQQPEEDWLAGLQADSAPQPSAFEQPAVDWAFQNDVGKPQAAEEETPDWLATLKAQDTSVNASAQPSKPAEADKKPTSVGLTAWLSELGGESAAPAAPPPVVQTPPPADNLSAGGDLPDWLAGLSQPPAAPAQAAPVAATAPPSAGLPAASDDFPDWLANLGNEISHPAVQPSQPAPAAAQDTSSGEAFPDWLTGLVSETPKTPVVAAPAATPASVFDTSPADNGTLPDWLEAATEKKPPEKPPVAPASTAKKAFGTGALEELSSLGQPDQLPEWMAGLVSAAPAKTPEPAAAPTPASADTFDWLSGSNQPESAAEKPEAAPASFDAAPLEASTSAATSIFDSSNAQSMDSIFSMEMPDWLSGFTPAEPEPVKTSENQPGPSSTEHISPADLPSWVQAMRPIESVMSGAQSDDEDQTVEKEGPLAGMRSVLPGQTKAPGLQKPKVYSIKLQVDATQMAQATLLENLIVSEAESRPVSTFRQVFNIRPLRWMIATVLLLAVLLPAILSPTGTLFFSLPALAAGETKDFYNQVEKLPDAAAVLVVFDYQPGYAGEMEQVAGPVIDHLMIRNVQLAFVSISPTGVLMTERIMAAQNKRRADAKQEQYGHDQYVDLGYLPGDAAGIQVFAQNPRILGSDYQAGDLWTSVAGFDQIRQLSDFKAIIVLTDNPDTGRMWIEQTGQALKGTPSLMVASAQAAPMIRPYYKSGQVQGMVSGLAGGAAYEATTQRLGNAALYWDCYGAGMIAAEMLIVVGGVWALIQHSRMRRAEQNQEEDEV